MAKQILDSKKIISAKVCAIVLNWNNWRDTLECLDSLTATMPCPDSIIVCDNGSTDDSVEKILQWAVSKGEKVLRINGDEGIFSRLTDKVVRLILITNSTNLGYSGGNNVGISYVLAQEQFDFVWVLNNDTLVAKDSLKELLSCVRQSKAGIFGSTVVYHSAPERIQCAGGMRYNPLTTIFRPVLGGHSLPEVLFVRDHPPIDYIYGASFFVRTEVFEKCGLFNEDFFLFYEELDFCRRARAKGYSLYWCRESIVEHKVSQSVGSADEKNKGKKVISSYHENLSTLLYTHLHHKNILPIVMVFRFLGKLAIIILRQEWYLIQPLVKAYRDFMRRRREDSSSA
ncbi:MAG: glycosyltransferase family 2 protein [Desulfobulbaceae bacterium]|uniref:Glycosyltransferase family 2 protein n=1 Tax=Candidatus Desulfobia pelagia TaxID=2841692 RepID=A0A8J6TB16_9BACT|nr:glycosyltransferase family 2 protein [Candidatus Desulfobia pelagia]